MTQYKLKNKDILLLSFIFFVISFVVLESLYSSKNAENISIHSELLEGPLKDKMDKDFETQNQTCFVISILLTTCFVFVLKKYEKPMSGN